MSFFARSFFLTLSLLISSTALSAQAPPIQFIFDGSGSMWGELDGSTKIEIAKAAIVEISQKLPEKQGLGLIAYGHRRERDCSDIEELLPISNIDQAQFLTQVQAIQPRGRTPLAQSVTLALEQLRSTGEAATVILFTDGIETCSGDLCALDEQLHFLQKHSRRIIWINPLAGRPGYESQTVSMQTALPYVDYFTSAHNLETLVEMIRWMG